MPRARRTTTLPWTLRMIERSGVTPFWVGFAVAAGYLALSLLWHNLAGPYHGIYVHDVPFWRTGWRVELVFGLLFAVPLSLATWVLRGARRDFDALRPVLRLSEKEAAAMRAGLMRFRRRDLVIAGLSGIAAGFALNAAVTLLLHSEVAHDPIWRVPRDLVLSWLVARLVFIALELGRRFSRLGEEHAHVDLLDPRPLAPFARFALRSAGSILVSASLCAPLFEELEALPVTIAIVVWIVLLAVGALLLPVRGVHRRIRSVKRAELWRVRGMISATRQNALAAGHPQALASAAALQGLAAYLTLVSGLSEWPFETATLVQFGAYLALPVGSWLGGAIMERLVALWFH
ncbi:MAG TPA: hypothetical protein DEP35_15040 [Deltaproteobacteria bacterium]|nr:hypothetical protein [Deltaproteobacteria bacterium]